ncbi:viroplasmin family protein [Clostridium cylindrosporum]|uniref:Ribonuclease H n=1 Tax=Clostridium cylindrosporum DSM 605 TaxID=1121307 RepID=A0A0J8G1P3_CLOCY|nr:ribonuclease H family protein [Clostridium cylindrosporum]KMT21671.1 putative ribonuclease [Clostridium cylindrosporum DSM 605]
MGKFYAVRKGRETGIFNTWNECQEKIKGFSGAEYKSFKSIEEAKEYINQNHKVDFDTNEDFVVAYVDGSYEDSIKKYGSGVLLLKEGTIIKEESFGGDEEELVSMRNVAGEIKAAEFAMNYCIDNGYNRLIIYYDYAGIENWCTGSWKAGKEGTIKYKENYNNMLSKGLKVQFRKVKAHSGDKFNDMADLLAKKGVIS